MGRGKILITGERADIFAGVTALAASESGLTPTLLDLTGEAAIGASGRLKMFESRSLLYDSFRLVGPFQAELAAAAYASALDLPSEEASMVLSAALGIAVQEDSISPPSLYDALAGIEGFRGTAVDRLRGRIASLKMMSATEDESVEDILEKGGAIGFRESPYPTAGDLAALLIASKWAAEAFVRRQHRSILVVSGSHRLFRSRRDDLASSFLRMLLDVTGSVAFSTNQPQLLAPVVRRSCSLRFTSGAAWNSGPPRGQSLTLPNSFVMEADMLSKFTPFVPRATTRTRGQTSTAVLPYVANLALRRMIMEEVGRYPLSTPESICQFLTPEFLASDVRAEIESLAAADALKVEPKPSPTGVRIFAFTLTETGTRLLAELRN